MNSWFYLFNHQEVVKTLVHVTPIFFDSIHSLVKLGIIAESPSVDFIRKRPPELVINSRYEIIHSPFILRGMDGEVNPFNTLRISSLIVRSFFGTPSIYKKISHQYKNQWLIFNLIYFNLRLCLL